MEKKEINLDKIKFRCLKIDEIPKCTELITETFAFFDPFIVNLNLSKEDLKEVVHEDLMKIIGDNLITVGIDENKNIIGCYAGFKLNKIPELNLIKTRQDSIRIKVQENQNKLQKLKILEHIDNNLIFDRFLLHLKKNELDCSIFCDYFCVSSLYFQTNLAKVLALNFFENCKHQGIRHIYGSFYNIKAVKLLLNNFNGEIGKLKFKHI